MAWRRRNRAGASPSAEDAFAGEVAALVAELLGVEAVPRAGFTLHLETAVGAQVTMHLDHLFAEVAGETGEARRTRLATAVRAALPPERPATWADAASVVMPALRNPSWGEPAGLGLRRPLLPFVSLAVVIDSPDAMRFVTEDDLAAWSVDRQTLERAALANLAARDPGIGRSGATTTVTGPDGYISSWLAVPLALAAALRSAGPLVALAPGRDHLVVVDPADERTATAAVLAATATYRSDPRRLSPVPYLLDGPTVTPWLPPAGHPAAGPARQAAAVLATVEYAHQRAVLEETGAGEGRDVFVGEHTLMGEGAGTWTYTTWARQVTDGLAPRVDYVVLVDNDDPDTVIEVPWDAVEEEAPGALVRDVAADPPLWHYTGWPDPPALDRLRRRAVPLPPPA